MWEKVKNILKWEFWWPISGILFFAFLLWLGWYHKDESGNIICFAPIDAEKGEINGTCITLVHWFQGAIACAGFVVSVFALHFFAKRMKNQEEQLELQKNKEIDDRFHSAIALLGNSETSARTGAIYSLYHLAIIDNKKYRRQIAEILCSHIRSKTQEDDYQSKHAKRPSNEIQTAINLLFKDVNSTQGLYVKFPVPRLPKANLSHAYLVGAGFYSAQCQKADFRHAQCQLTEFRSAQCQGAIFRSAQCQGAIFRSAQCQGADFRHAQCQLTEFRSAQCQEADFSSAECQEAKFRRTECQKAKFHSAECQGADFRHAQCQGAKFRSTQCQEVDFRRAECQGADFRHAQCQGAKFRSTQCQEVDFRRAECQGADFRHAQCQEANFHRTQCQGVNFHSTQCQGANFHSAQCQGAYASLDIKLLQLNQRINQDTQLETLVISGAIAEEAIDAIKKAEKFLSGRQYEKLLKIIEDNEGKSITHDTPDGMITGVLEDSPELQEIIKKLGDSDKDSGIFTSQ